MKMTEIEDEQINKKNAVTQNDFVPSYAKQSNTNWREFICGWGAGTMNIAVTYPINKVIFRQVCNPYYKTLCLSRINIIFLER